MDKATLVVAGIILVISGYLALAPSSTPQTAGSMLILFIIDVIIIIRGLHKNKKEKGRLI